MIDEWGKTPKPAILSPEERDWQQLFVKVGAYPSRSFALPH
jgi:hypothetical protein